MAELCDAFKGERRIGVAVELVHRLLRFPHGGDIAVRVPRADQPAQLLFAGLAQALCGPDEQAPTAVTGAGLASSVPERLVPHAPSVLIGFGPTVIT